MRKTIILTVILTLLFTSVCFAYGMEKGTVAYYKYPIIVAVTGYSNYTIAKIWSGYPSIYEGNRVVGDLNSYSSTDWYFPNSDDICTVYIEKQTYSKDEVIRWLIEH
jgi:hypothetical protein